MDSKDLAFIAFGTNCRELYNYLQNTPTHGHGKCSITITITAADLSTIKQQIKQCDWRMRSSALHQHTYKNGKVVFHAASKKNGKAITHYEVAISRRPAVDESLVAQLKDRLNANPWSKFSQLLATVRENSPATAELIQLIVDNQQAEYKWLSNKLADAQKGVPQRW